MRNYNVKLDCLWDSMTEGEILGKLVYFEDFYGVVTVHSMDEIGYGGCFVSKRRTV
jgi:hypothetical protein